MVCFGAKADVPFQWTQSETMGIQTASVGVKGGGGFYISCGSSGMAPANVSDIDIGYSPKPGDPAQKIQGADTLQLVIDGKTFQLPGNGVSLAQGALYAYGNYNSFLEFEQALLHTNQEYFQFQIPEANFSVDVSTVGAKEALAEGPNTSQVITDFCK